MTNPDTSESNGSRFTVPLWVWVATVAALLVFAATLWQAKKLRGQVTELQVQMRLEQSRKESLEAQRQEMDQIRALLAAPETRAVQVRPVSAATQSFKIFWNEGIGLLVTAQDMPAIPAGRVLQLWIAPKKGSAISAGIFQPEASGTVMKLTRPATPIVMKDAAALTITVEPAGGSAQPTGEPQWMGRIN